MNWSRSLCLTLSALAASTLAQFVAPPTDLIKKTGYAGIDVRYKQVPPGICELNPHVKSFSGYADVADGQHLFFWFFEARNGKPEEAPLTLWINGGPGSSSMIGLWQELGPCYVNASGDVYNNPNSWSEVSNMIFIDQPTQVGFSYSEPVPAYISPDSGDIVQLPDNTCPDYASDWSCGTYSYPNITLTANSTTNAAPYLWKALQGFMGAFPQYSREGFVFATESYGGHYGPTFSEYIEEQNAELPYGAKEIHMEGVLIGNGWYDPLLQYAGYYNFTVFPGNTYDVTVNSTVAEIMHNGMYGKGNCWDQTIDCYNTGRDDVCSASDSFCYNEVEVIYDTYLGRDEYDVRELTPDPFPPNFYFDYLNTEKVQKAIGAYQNYTDFGPAVGSAFGTTGDDDRVLSIIDDMRKLVEADLNVVMYFGDADYICNWIGGYAVANEIAVPGFESAGFVNVSTSDGVVHGQVKSVGKFSFLRVFESGHEVPFYQPVIALAMIERTTKGLDIATGKVKTGPGYKTKGPRDSTYREGNSTVQKKVIPTDWIYDLTTNIPHAPPKGSKSPSRRMARRGAPVRRH
ncbi:alpha/beta-hydrolase [Rhizodiscina lignyota]|uniref:Alpha/beta-hydrolase n=1 Tax=Rhizodiscina lignyota TaxID=1504668 RepID=A0A9P4IEM3_9PEZI|nr:alpha/beta-hydrolase [Rhizodiscina lignyota]